MSNVFTSACLGTARLRSILKVALPLIVVALLIRGAMYFVVDLRPADRVQLERSTWTISELDGRALDGELLLLTFDSSTTGEIASRCLRLRFDYDLDSDDIGFEFYDLATSAPECPTDSAMEATVRSVLGRIESWTAPSANRVEFFDGGGPPLLSRPILTADQLTYRGRPESDGGRHALGIWILDALGRADAAEDDLPRVTLRDAD